ncbi:MAG: hypothetical protein PVH19_13515 [Planctomycetia bacterium]
MYEAADGIEVEHAHAHHWFSEEHLSQNATNGAVWEAIKAEIAVGRHAGTANYLYADGHVDSISSEQIQTWTVEPSPESPFNFAAPR